jgi:hypothetical protein
MPAQTSDLQTWIKLDDVDYNMVLDPDAMNLGVFFTESSLPWNADIDVRTMEVLDQGVGYDGMTVADIGVWLSWVEKNPPSYPCPDGEALSSTGMTCMVSK